MLRKTAVEVACLDSLRYSLPDLLPKNGKSAPGNLLNVFCLWRFGAAEANCEYQS
jgi:hypothetical protein